MVVVSFHLRKPKFTLSSVIVVCIGGIVFIFGVIANDVKNSLRCASLPYHCGGIVPSSSSFAGFERLVNVSSSWICPYPHGDANAARK